MKFGVISEAQVNRGMSYGVRLREAIDELVFAEEMGFDFIGFSEQHFMAGQWSTPAPELLMAVLADRTHSIKLRQMAVVNLALNHPLRIAERLATLDLLTKGRNRVEIASARSNNAKYMNAFNIDPSKTRAEWRENLEVMIRGLYQDEVEFDGEYYKVGRVALTPKQESKEQIPVYVTATSADSHYQIGKLGLNLMTADTYVGWEYQQMLIDEYQKGLADAEPIGGLYEPSGNITGFTFPAYCAENNEKALEEAAPNVFGMLESVRELAEGLIATKAPGYQYWEDFAQRLKIRGNDLKYLNDSTPMIMVGDPDWFIERVYKLKAMGINEVVLKIDGYGHSKTKKAIEMIGKYVIPEFKSHKGSVPENNYVQMGINNVGKFEL
ncbi:LLM class flavin-dependent oxidoreductase [Streptomyces sp. NPDC029554]|uniref:LLM class flavin-dependent oxidoreductase n=1 Tax=Streptomyces sp. NPDC029554 TaxID=3155126 RepID=UPI00340652B8